MRSQRPSDNNNIISALVYTPEPDGKNLFLQTSQTGVIEHGIIKLVLTLKPHPFQLALIVLGSALGTLPEQKIIISLIQLWLLQATLITVLTICTVVAQMLWE